MLWGSAALQPQRHPLILIQPIYQDKPLLAVNGNNVYLLLAARIPANRIISIQNVKEKIQVECSQEKEDQKDKSRIMPAAFFVFAAFIALSSSEDVF